jgi:hypothetical protein
MSLTKKDRQGLLMIGAAVLALGAIVAAKVVMGEKPRAGDDGCVGAVATSTVIVLDHSETLTRQTRDEIIARALAHVERAPANERVTVFKVSEVSKKQLEPAFSRCKPARQGNRMVEDTRGLEKTYQAKFHAPLTSVLEGSPSNGKESPVAQAILDVSLSQYLRTSKNSLLVFSDLLEHTPKFSMYQCGDPQKAIGHFRESRRGAMERPKFRETAVYLHIIPRQDIARSTLKCRDHVWAWFFGDNEGGYATTETDYLPGG